jgi:hypothetical protein
MKLQITVDVDLPLYLKKLGYKTLEEAEADEDVDFDLMESLDEEINEKLYKLGIEVESIKKIVVASGEDDNDNEDEIYYEDDFSSDDEEVPADVDDLLEYFTELGEKIHGQYGASDFIRFCAEDDDDLPDGGWTDTINVKRGSRTFELEIEFETEWCGDWSVRANLPSDYTILSVKETTV